MQRPGPQCRVNHGHSKMCCYILNGSDGTPGMQSSPQKFSDLITKQNVVILVAKNECRPKFRKSQVSFSCAHIFHVPQIHVCSFIIMPPNYGMLTQIMPFSLLTCTELSILTRGVQDLDLIPNLWSLVPVPQPLHFLFHQEQVFPFSDNSIWVPQTSASQKQILVARGQKVETAPANLIFLPVRSPIQSFVSITNYCVKTREDQLKG